MTSRERLKAALRLARYRAAQHTHSSWLTIPEGSERLVEQCVTLPVEDVLLMIKAATKTLAHTA